MTPTAVPQNLLQWLSHLWTTAQFAGPPDRVTRIRFVHLMILITLPATLLGVCLDHHLLEPDEGRYAQIPREMVETGDWIVPTLQSEAYLDKPPLMYWLVALSYRTFGICEAAARLIPAASVLLTILAVYLIGRRSLGSQAAFWAALFLTISPGYLEMGRLLILDGLLTCCVTTSLLCGYEAVRTGRLQLGWWIASAAASGLGFLTKGPIAEVLLFPPLFAFGWLTGTTARVGLRNYALFFAIVLGISVPWYAAMYSRQPEFLGHFFWQHNVMRFLQPFDHLQPVWYYLPVVLGGLLPVMLFLVPMLVRLIFGSTQHAANRSSSTGFWLLVGGWCVLFFSCSGSKLPTYVLPAFPPLCLAVGECIARMNRKWLPISVAIGFALLLFVTNTWLLPWYAKERSPVGRPDMVLPYVSDPAVLVVTFPRTVDSLSFAVGRRDFDRTRSKDMNQVILDSHFRPKTVVLFTHRSSYETFRQSLPPSLIVSESITLKRPKSRWGTIDKLVGDTPWGLCHIAVLQPATAVHTQADPDDD